MLDGQQYLHSTGKILQELPPRTCLPPCVSPAVPVLRPLGQEAVQRPVVSSESEDVRMCIQLFVFADGVSEGGLVVEEAVSPTASKIWKWAVMFQDVLGSRTGAKDGPEDFARAAVSVRTPGRGEGPILSGRGRYSVGRISAE